MNKYADTGTEQKLKVIFLDIDGVMNRIAPKKDTDRRAHTGAGDGEQPVCAVEEEKIRLLAKLADRTGAKIVLHSGWRFFFQGDLQPACPEAEKLVRLFDRYGLSLYGVTPDLTDEEIRRTKKFSRVKAREILLWLRMHAGKEEEISWVVLDDLDLHEETVTSHQIRTDGRIGLTEREVEAAVRLLQEESAG